ncbi:uncharacterized protein LOC126648051 isoform X10 [Myiozetetes cayanensis]|uniref:uncharacterized protein LOC126648051 isoform X10 n=1 Tax=Myiozetetes cayanensis TaxID=478635 RepID=UPI002160E412|nr:uncharacterized protein LOC126648051 isoform X10 [Myiozetetes cayanensis]
MSIFTILLSLADQLAQVSVDQRSILWALHQSSQQSEGHRSPLSKGNPFATPKGTPVIHQRRAQQAHPTQPHHPAPALQECPGGHGLTPARIVPRFRRQKLRVQFQSSVIPASSCPPHLDSPEEKPKRRLWVVQDYSCQGQALRVGELPLQEFDFLWHPSEFPSYLLQGLAGAGCASEEALGGWNTQPELRLQVHIHPGVRVREVSCTPNTTAPGTRSLQFQGKGQD